MRTVMAIASSSETRAFAFGLSCGHVLLSGDEHASYRRRNVSVRRSCYQRRPIRRVLTPTQQVQTPLVGTWGLRQAALPFV